MEKTWKQERLEIDALPLWEVPPETRPPRRSIEYDRLCSRCYQLLSPTKGLQDSKPVPDAWDGFNIAFMEAFIRSYERFIRHNATDSFCAYLSASIAHMQKDAQRQEQEQERFGFALSKSTAQKIKKIRCMLEASGEALSSLFSDPERFSHLARAVHMREENLRAILTRQLDMERLDDTTDEEDGVQQQDRILNTVQILPESDSESDDTSINRLMNHLLLSSLEEKETWSAKYALFFSGYILGDIRLRDSAASQENFSERLARCDEWRRFEDNHCLWDTLLLRDYVRFTIQEPFPDMLKNSAVNPLKREAFPPHQVKTMAAFQGVSPAAISQRSKGWQTMLQVLLRPQERRNPHE